MYLCIHMSTWIHICMYVYIYIYAYFLWWRILWALYDIIYHLHNITSECPYNIIILWCWILNALCNILPFYVCCFYLKCVLCITIIMCFVSNDEIKMFNQSITFIQHWLGRLLGAKQPTNHYLSQWWHNLLTHIRVSRPHWDNVFKGRLNNNNRQH